MKNRDYIEHIKTFLNVKYSNEKESSGFVTREFFESSILKDEIKIGLKQLETFGLLPLNDDRFDEVYRISIKETKHNNQTSMSPSISLVGDAIKDKIWLTNERIKYLKWEDDELITYRTRYFRFLQEIGRSKTYINETKRSSLEILKKMGDPQSSSKFFIRGLVVGSVQSGKTSNFNAVINSSIDAGYDLIIVLSGIMEDLRRQTQLRIEKEVEGKYIGGKFIGVGNISSFGQLGDYKEVRQIVVPTSPDVDFNKSIKEAEFTLNNKNVLICKKNTGVLKNLLLWLENYLNENKDKIGIPLLIIDDEADNASLNNLGSKGIEFASTINKEIRAILALFNKKTYLGYTATPFGNILQDRNEAPENKWEITQTINGRIEKKVFDIESSLFPNDFIELLFPPPNYIGPKHFFKTVYSDIKKIDPLIPGIVDDHINHFPSRVIKDTEQPTTNFGKDTRAAKKNDDFPKKLPQSLKEAIMCFVVSTAIRISRKADMIDSKMFQPHNSMLIHISRFTPWQNKTKKLVQAYIKELTENLNNDLPSDKNLIYGNFEILWYKYYAYVIENIKNYLPEDYEDPYLTPKTFSEIKPLLITAIKDVEVVAINSMSKDDKLIYLEESEKKYIAIGGNRLSRGFTLEGLTINYFIRNTNYADTLLQMGRWFGYRPGYLDCCKLFSTNDSLEKFDLTSETIEDLELKFIEMNRSKSTPSKYALRVLKPSALKVTRESILKNANEINWSFSDSLEQTTKFLLDPERIDKAWIELKNHIAKFKFKADLKKNDYLIFETTNVEDLISFLNLSNSFNTSDNSQNYFAEVIEFIKLCNEKDFLTNWSIAIKRKGSGRILPAIETGLIWDIERTQRGGPQFESRWYSILKNDRVFAAGGASSNIVTGANDMAIRLDEIQINRAKEEFKKQLKNELIAKKGIDETISDIEKKVNKTNIPEKVFRRQMSEKEGILMIYLMDLAEVFKHDNKDIIGLESLQASLNLDTPLIGYAIGIPPINAEIGGSYLQSKFHQDQELEEDYDEIKEILE